MSRSLARLVACVLFMLWALPSLARPTAPPVINEAAIDAIVLDSMREQNIPGAALAIVHDGKAIFAKGYGKANLEHELPVTRDSVFLLASISKPMLAVGIALLAEQGKLSIDDPVAKHIPNTPATWQGITLRHLLNHTSGIRRESPAFNGDKAIPDLELINATFPEPLEFPTGSKSQYCNICYFTLAEVIARTSGQPWPRFMADQVFKPAGMQATRTSSVTDLIPGRVVSYGWKDGRYSIIREFLAVRPSGAFASSLNDMIRWEAALKDNKLIKAESLAAMVEPARFKDGKVVPFGDPAQNMGYGLGWLINEAEGQQRVSHGGSLAGFRTLHARYPERGMAIILLTNSANARVNTIEARLAKLLLARAR